MDITVEHHNDGTNLLLCRSRDTALMQRLNFTGPDGEEWWMRPGSRLEDRLRRIRGQGVNVTLVDRRNWRGWYWVGRRGDYWYLRGESQEVAVAELDIDILTFYACDGDELESATDLRPSQNDDMVEHWSRQHGVIMPDAVLLPAKLTHADRAFESIRKLIDGPDDCHTVFPDLLLMWARISLGFFDPETDGVAYMLPQDSPDYLADGFVICLVLDQTIGFLTALGHCTTEPGDALIYESRAAADTAITTDALAPELWVSGLINRTFFIKSQATW